MRPQICVSVMPRSADEAKTLQDKAKRKGADLVEIRLDRLKRPSELRWVSQTEIPMIATVRPTDHGGEFTGSKEERFRTLLDAAQIGFDYVDIDDSTDGLEAKIKTLKDSGVKIICSHHDIETTPPLPQLKEILNRNSRNGADIYKIVTTARTIQDSLVTLNFISEAPRQLKVVCFAMGELGKISRVACPIFGSFFTMAALEAGAETAPGQLTIDDLRTMYGRMKLD